MFEQELLTFKFIIETNATVKINSETCVQSHMKCSTVTDSNLLYATARSPEAWARNPNSCSILSTDCTIHISVRKQFCQHKLSASVLHKE